MILDRFYRAYKAEVASAPRDYSREAVNCFIRVAKVV